MGPPSRPRRHAHRATGHCVAGMENYSAYVKYVGEVRISFCGVLRDTAGTVDDLIPRVTRTLYREIVALGMP